MTQVSTQIVLHNAVIVPKDKNGQWINESHDSAKKVVIPRNQYFFPWPLLITNQFLFSTSAPILGSGPHHIFGPRAKLLSKNQPFFDEIRRILQVQGPIFKKFPRPKSRKLEFFDRCDVTYALRLNERHCHLFLYMTFIKLKPEICPLSSFHA